MKVPESLEPHKDDYKNRAWENYSMQELGNWVHLLMKRSSHRSNPVKKRKDLYDAQNYLDMMQKKLDHEHDKI